MKSKRKKHNPIKRAQRVARLELSNFAIIYASTNDKKYLLNEIKCEIIKRTDSFTATAIEKLRWRWSVMCVAFGVERNGKLKAAPIQIDANGEYFYHELADMLSKEHADFARKCNENMTVFGVGWYAVPRVTDMDLEKIMPAFELLDCWNQDKHYPLKF
jgi:hypothetical protein